MNIVHRQDTCNQSLTNIDDIENERWSKACHRWIDRTALQVFKVRFNPSYLQTAINIFSEVAGKREGNSGAGPLCEKNAASYEYLGVKFGQT